MKTALGFRSAQTLLNLASSIRGAVFWLILFVKSKSKSKNGFASLIELFLLASLGLGAIFLQGKPRLIAR